MKHAFYLLSILCLLIATPQGQAKDDYPLRDLKESTARGGLPNFYQKIADGKDITIAYLGGSITAQPGWRVLSQKWFEKQHPNVKFKGIHAAIGGTGSGLGVFRLGRDVLKHKPDLLFVEFAVNDARTKPDQIIKNMEGIVRQTWKQFPDCDICFVYTLTHSNIKTLQSGKMQRSASAMEELADFYQIPTIHFGVEISKLEKEGKLVMKAAKAKMSAVSGDSLNEAAALPVNADGKIPFSKDGVHPYTNTGHTLYMSAIARSIPAIKAAGKVGSHALTPPLNKNNLEYAKMLPLKAQMFTGPVTLLPKDKGNGKRFRNRCDGLWKAQPGAKLSFKFKGSKLQIYDLLGPGCGTVQITIDGKTTQRTRMDGYCTYYRLATLGVANNLDPNMVHSVELAVLNEPYDKSKKLFERNRKDFEKKPDKYKNIDWYLGAIMIIGELVND